MQRKKWGIIRRIASLGQFILCLLLCFVSIGCGAQPEQSAADISAYLERFEAMDYEGMYAQTSPIVDIDKDGFIKKYEDIFSGLGVNQVVIDDVSEPSENGTFYVSATYKTKQYGDYTNTFEIQTGFVENSCRVLWDYCLIFPEMDEGYHVRVQTLYADRGEIFAADGSLLAANTFATTLYMDTSKVQDIASVANTVRPLTGLSDSEVMEIFNDALEKGTRIVALDEFLADELTQQQEDAVLAVAGLGIDDEMYTPIRDYPMGEYAAHILGYTGFYNEDELPEGYTISDRVGRSGLEAAYEQQLRGSDGKIIYIEDKWGNSVRTLYHVPMQQGQDLRLTIKPQLQKRAYDALSTMLEGDEKGVAIVMDADTGQLEALVSYPSFDNNLFTFGLSQEQWDFFQDEENNRPLFFRATQGLYPPGSVFKPFVASAVLEKGAVIPETVFDGVIVDNVWQPTMEGWYWSKGITRIKDSGSPLKLYNAMTKSDNIYFAFASLRLGDSAFMEYMGRIGMEEAVPFDLPLKEANLVKPSTQLDLRLLADMGYGQGEVLVTPLQMAAMYTAFANGSGDILQPILVEKLCQTDGVEYNTVQENVRTVWIENAVSNQNLNILLPMLHDVVHGGGTGYPVKMSGVDIGGKTGTAEIGNNKAREISWFAGYWEDGYYDRLVVVMVDTAAEEGVVKFDIAKELLAP